MRKKPAEFFALVLLLINLNVFSQCTGGTLEGTIIPTTAWQTVATKSNHFYKFSATAGNVYYFSYCPCDGGSIGYSAELSLDSTAALSVNGEYGDVNYNSGFCADAFDAPRIEWKCMTSGVYRILTTEQYCDTDHYLTGTLAYKYVTPSLCYSVSSISYSPDAYSTGTVISMASANKDDGISGYITLPFSFCFNGQSYSQIFVTANGYIVFKNGCDLINEDTTNYFPPSSYTMQNLPFSNSTLTQILSPGVLAPWLDLYPAPVGGGKMKYSTYGVAPNRRFTVKWDSIEMFSCTGKRCLYEVQLYETNYNIQIQAKVADTCHAWIPPGGQGVEGILDETGYAAVVPPGRNLTQWKSSNEAWKFVPSCCAVLPIQLLSFTCQPLNDGILLNWSSATETNNKYYTLLRSADGFNFAPIATVPGAGNSETVKNYSYTDIQPLSGNNYYQLEQTDFDGHTQNYNTVSCSSDFVTPGTIMPNPATGEFALSLYYSNEPQTVTICDGTGRIVFSQTYQNMKGANPIINISSLKPGIYIVSINCQTINPIVRKLLIK